MTGDNINVDAFGLTVSHGVFHFGGMVIIDYQEGDAPGRAKTIHAPLPPLWNLKGNEDLQVVDEDGRPRTPGRPETRQAREAWMRKHFLPQVWGLRGEEAVSAFRRQYGGISGKPGAVGLRFSEVRSAWDSHRKRAARKDEAFDQGTAPPQAFQYILLAAWDYVFSHLSAQQIHDFFPFEQWPAVSEDAIYQAVNRYGLPWTPGPAYVPIKPPLNVNP